MLFHFRIFIFQWFLVIEESFIKVIRTCNRYYQLIIFLLKKIVGEMGVVLRLNTVKDARKAVRHILKQLKRNGLEVEVDYRTFDVFIVDINEQWYKEK